MQLSFQSYYISKGKKKYVKTGTVARLVLILSLAFGSTPIMADYLPLKDNPLSEPKLYEDEDINTHNQKLLAVLKEEDPQLYCYGKAESQLTAGAFNPNDVGNTPRCGILQFMWETYIEECVYKYGLPYVDKATYNTKELCNKYTDIESQITCARKMIDNHLGKRWGAGTRELCKKYN